MPTYLPKINGTEYAPGAIIETDGPATFTIRSDVRVEGITLNSGQWIQAGHDANGDAFLVLPLGKYYDVIAKHAGGKHGYLTSFELVQKPTAPIGANITVPLTAVPTKPRPTFAPGGHTMAANLSTQGATVNAVELTAGGDTIGPDGKKYTTAGYGYQFSADVCSLTNVKATTFSDYFLYVRPGTKGGLLDNVEIRGGTNFEACIRNDDGELSINYTTIIQDHPGIDSKRSRTLLRGPGKWSAENSIFAGGTCGAGNPMSRLNAGQDLGFGEFQLGRGIEGGQILRGPLIMSGVQATIDARAAGKSRLDCIKAGIVGSLLRAANAPDLDTIAVDTAWNRDRMLNKRGSVTYTNCRFDISPDGVPCTIELQAGNVAKFIDCSAAAGTIFKLETSYPDNFVYADRHPTNTDWTLPDDTLRPVPQSVASNFRVAGVVTNPFPAVAQS